MTADEARDLFADAAEGNLGERREAFEQAIAADAELEGEYALYKQLMGATRAMGDEEAPDATAPAILPAVQKKIRVRSRGRFFKDRFAESGDKNTLTLVLTMAVLLLVAATIVVVQNLVVVDLPAPAASE